MFRTRIVLVALSSLVTLLSFTGCVASLQAEPAYVEVSNVPANIEIYPHEYYEGRTVYLVNDNWYYRDGARWVYYRQEPAPLNQRRMYIQQAPPASRRYSATPASHREPTRAAPASHREPTRAAPASRRVQRAHSDDNHADRHEDRRGER